MPEPTSRSYRLFVFTVLVVLVSAVAPVPCVAALPKVADGFKIRLVAAVPAIQYPCQVATAPDGSLFVAEDPMDQPGPADKPIDRILLFKGDKEPIVFADKLNAVFGMAWHDGALYVMNMPNLTVFRDRDGDGKADDRKELFTNLGVPAGFPNNFNDHIVSGIKFGIDGYLYVSVGDKGVPNAKGIDGRTAQIKGGGTLRCRPDGTGLEVFTTGTRNHLEPNLDDRDQLFTYDNTDDGLGWWTRVTHHIDGGYYGYPFDYHKRTDRTLPRMAEYGGGSPCGGVFYGEDAWPESYRGRLLWSEWGKRVVSAFRFEPDGASYKVADKIDLVQAGDVETFRPLDLALSPDGRVLYIADWSMGGWGAKSEKLGRVYALTYEGSSKSKIRPRGKDSDPIDAQVRELDHPSYHERCRAQAALITKGEPALVAATAALANPNIPALAKRHLVWVIDALAGATPKGSFPLIEALGSPVADVRAQAARALGERAVPIALEPLTALLKDQDPSVRLQAVIALGRLANPAAITELLPVLADKDTFLAYSARAALKRIDDWPAAARGLDSADPSVRLGVLRAMDLVYDVSAVDVLAKFVKSPSRDGSERIKAIQFLAEVHRKAAPWDGNWWGTQPAKQKPPAKTIAWDGTPKVMGSIRELLRDPATPVRIAAIEAVVTTGDPDLLPDLRRLFTSAEPLEIQRASAHALGELADAGSLDQLTSSLVDPRTPPLVRDAALEAVETIGTSKAVAALSVLLEKGSLPADRQPRVIAALGRSGDRSAIAPLLQVLRGRVIPARAAAIDALVAILNTKPDGKKKQKTDSSAKPEKDPQSSAIAADIRPMLKDPAFEVRLRAIAAAAALGDRDAIPALVQAADSADTRFEAGLALAALPDVRALSIYVAGLTDRNTDLRRACSSAISAIRDQAAPILGQLALRHELSSAAIPELRTIYLSSQPITSWSIVAPVPMSGVAAIVPDQPINVSTELAVGDGKRLAWRKVKASGGGGEVDLGRLHSGDEVAAYAYTDVESPMDRKAQMFVGSDDTLRVWLNGQQVFDFKDSRGFSAESNQFEVALRKGTNRLLVLCGNHGGIWKFAVAISPVDQYEFLKGPARQSFDPEAYRLAALEPAGDSRLGRRLFGDLKGLACIKCHAVDKQGGNVGPELSSVGAKYPREELIAAVLYPSAKISSGYEPVTIAMDDGRVLTGIVRSETAKELEIQDADAKLIRIPKDRIEERKLSDVSLMPSGLAQGLSVKDFTDLISYLQTLKNPQEPGK